MNQQQLQTYKTSLCRHFMQKGMCSLFDQCHFAHGRQQLRNKTDPQPNYVPPSCQYYMNGFCRNEAQCSFAHGSLDLRGMIIATENPNAGLGQIQQLQNISQIQNMSQMPQQQQHPNQQYHSLQSFSAQNKHPAPQLQPDYGQAGEFLRSILRNLEQVFPDDIQKKVLISKGMQLVDAHELPQANDIINELVHSTNLTQQQKQQCQTILSNAYSLHKVNSFNF